VPPDVVIGAPQPVTARATAAISGGAVIDVPVANISNNGFYSSPPSVTIGAPTGFNGTNAQAVAQLGSGITAGRVTNIAITRAGSGYQSAPYVIIAPPVTIQAAALVTGISGAGAVTNFTVTDSGAGYRTNAPGVLIGAPPSLTVPTNAPVSLSARSLTNTPLVGVSAFHLLLNNRPVATNTAVNNSPANESFSFISPTNIGTNTISVRSVNAQGLILGQSPWTTMIVE
jgi:hypothetical protein